MLKKRIVTAISGAAILIGVTWLGDPWFTLLIALWGLAACYEFYRLVTTSQARPLTYFGLLWSLLFILHRNPGVLSLFGGGFEPNLFTPLLLTSAVIISLIWLLLRSPKDKAFISWAWTVAGIFYIGWLISHLVAIRVLDARSGFNDGSNWVLFAFFVTFASDTSAFLVGRNLGKHRLAPYISPRKTWEGAIGGLAGAALVSLIFILPTPLRLPITFGQAILGGILVSVFGQLGDLVESLFKRNTGAKDSGRLFPGHGGALDRLDSVLFASVMVYYYVIWVIR